MCERGGREGGVRGERETCSSSMDLNPLQNLDEICWKNPLHIVDADAFDVATKIFYAPRNMTTEYYCCYNKYIICINNMLHIYIETTIKKFKLNKNIFFYAYIFSTIFILWWQVNSTQKNSTGKISPMESNTYGSF